MTRVFTLDAIARCESRGHHVFRFVWSWNEVGFDECEDCGAMGPWWERQRARPVVSTRALRAMADDGTRQARNDYIRELRAAGAELLELSKQFGMSIQMVSRICTGVQRGAGGRDAIEAVRARHAVGT